MNILGQLIFILTIFAFSFGGIAQEQLGLTLYGEAMGDQFGTAISMPDSVTIAVGGPHNHGNGTRSGHVRVFVWNGTKWNQKGTDIDGEYLGDKAGCAVSMPNANIIAIGAEQNNGSTTDEGHVRVLVWDGAEWVQKGKDIDGKDAFDRFGISVSMPNENTVAAGSMRDDGGGMDAGAVVVYNWNGSGWIQKGADILGDRAEDLSGYCLDMPDSNTIAIGSPYHTTADTNAGQVRVFTWENNQWRQKGRALYGSGPNNGFGKALSMPDQNTIAIGEPEYDGVENGTGSLKVYDWDGSDWILRGNKIQGSFLWQRLGASISMPSKNVVAVGSSGNNGVGLNAGLALVYEWSGNLWTLKDSIPSTGIDHHTGNAVFMPDETTLAVGSINNDDKFDNAGCVQVFKRNLATSHVAKFKNYSRQTGTIYPNPTTNGEVNIAFSSIQEQATIVIYSATGQEVLRKEIENSNQTTTALTGDAGIYHVVVVSADGAQQHFRVVKR